MMTTKSIHQRVPYRPGYSGEGALPRDWKPGRSTAAPKPKKAASKKGKD